MQKLLKETGIAAVVFFGLSWAFGLGGNDERTIGQAMMAGITFAILYFLIGLVIRWIKGRQS
jgi:hypothetical protein